jgi:hypothetical protein
VAYKSPYSIKNQGVDPESLLPRPQASECVAELSYDLETETATCEFVKRGTYTYSGVEPQVFLEWNTAGSRGEYFNNYIRGQYSYERIG